MATVISESQETRTYVDNAFSTSVARRQFDTYIYLVKMQRMLITIKHWLIDVHNLLLNVYLKSTINQYWFSTKQLKRNHKEKILEYIYSFLTPLWGTKGGSKPLHLLSLLEWANTPNRIHPPTYITLARLDVNKAYTDAKTINVQQRKAMIGDKPNPMEQLKKRRKYNENSIVLPGFSNSSLAPGNFWCFSK